jgi:hypothetical protein
VFGPGEVSRDVVESAVAAACAAAPAGDWSIVAVDSPAARRRLVISAPPAAGSLRTAPTLLVVCARTASDTSEQGALLLAGAVIRGLAVALHAQGVGWSWDPNASPDSETTRAALGLGEDWRPLGIVAVGRMTEGGA